MGNPTLAAQQTHKFAIHPTLHVTAPCSDKTSRRAHNPPPTPTHPRSHMICFTPSNLIAYEMGIIEQQWGRHTHSVRLFIITKEPSRLQITRKLINLTAYYIHFRITKTMSFRYGGAFSHVPSYQLLHQSTMSHRLGQFLCLIGRSREPSALIAVHNSRGDQMQNKAPAHSIQMAHFSLCRREEKAVPYRQVCSE